MSAALLAQAFEELDGIESAEVYQDSTLDGCAGEYRVPLAVLLRPEVGGEFFLVIASKFKDRPQDAVSFYDGAVAQRISMRRAGVV